MSNQDLSEDLNFHLLLENRKKRAESALQNSKISGFNNKTVLFYLLYIGHGAHKRVIHFEKYTGSKKDRIKPEKLTKMNLSL